MKCDGITRAQRSHLLTLGASASSHYRFQPGTGSHTGALAALDAEAGGSLEPRRSVLSCAMPVSCPHEVQHQYGHLLGRGDHHLAREG